MLAQVGIPRLYIDAIADRLNVEGFRMGGSGEVDDDLWGWYEANNLDNLARLAYVDAMVYGRAYITVSAPDEVDSENPLLVPDTPLIRVESPLNLFAKINPRTREVEWAVRVVKDEDGSDAAATLYLRDRTELYIAQEGKLALSDTITHGLGVVPVVQMARPSGVVDLYGTTMITPEIKSITDAISRTMMDMQTTSNLMATPQRAVFGTTLEELTGDKEGLTPLQVYTAAYLAVEDPAGKIEQLAAAELRNYTDALTFMLKMAASYTGLPPQYLSFSDDNPASAEAIRSAETRLIQTCESIAKMFGEAWEQAMRIALIVMGQKLTIEHFRMETIWRDPGTPTYQAKADAATKLYAGGTGVIPLEQARIDMGYTAEERKLMEEWDKTSPMAQAASLYGGRDPFSSPYQEEVDVGSEPVPDGAET